MADLTQKPESLLPEGVNEPSPNPPVATPNPSLEGIPIPPSPPIFPPVPPSLAPSSLPPEVELVSETFPSPPVAAPPMEESPSPSEPSPITITEVSDGATWSPSPSKEELVVTPRLSIEVPPPTPPPPSPTSVTPETPAPKPSETPPTPEVKLGQPSPVLPKLFLFLVGILILGALVFGIWKFALPMLPFEFKPGGVKLTYWGLWEDENVFIPLINEYEKNHRSVKIEYKKQSPTEYRERLQVSITQGKGPDIFRFHNTWLPMLKNELSPVPTTVFSLSDFQKTFYPVATQDLKLGDSLYGIPLEIDGLALLYNVDIFKAAGVSPPTTWEGFQKAAVILTVKDAQKRIQTSGLALGTTNNVDNWSDILAEMFLQDGVDLKNPQGKLAEDALIFYTSFAQGDNKTWDETLPPSTLAFTQGKVAMIFVPSWQIINIKAKNPQLNFKVLPVPQLPGINVTWASYWVEGVSVKSPHQAEAWDFLKYLSQKETLVKFYTEASKTRLFGEPYSRQDLAQSLKDDPYLGPYIQQAPRAQSFYLASQTFDNGINDKLIKYLEDTVNAVNRGVSPRSALETTAQGFKQVLSTYGVATSPSK